MNGSIALSSICRSFVKAAETTAKTSSQAKKAEDAPLTGVLHEMLNQKAKQDAIRQMGQVALGGLAIGGAVRGGQGLINMVRRNMQPSKPVQAPLSFSVGAPGQSGEEPMSDQQVMSLGKMAADPASGGMLSDIGSSVWNHTGGPVMDWVGGHTAERPEQLMPYYAGMGMAGAGGIYGGYHAMDALMQNRRKAEINAEEEKAKQQYLQSIGHLTAKHSREEKLQELYKRAFDLQEMGSMAAAPWPFLALGAGIPAYNITAQRRKSQLLAKAVRQRQKDQLSNAPVFAYTADSGSGGEQTPLT